jgi:hypothetical protein
MILIFNGNLKQDGQVTCGTEILHKILNVANIGKDGHFL